MSEHDSIKKLLESRKPNDFRKQLGLCLTNIDNSMTKDVHKGQMKNLISLYSMLDNIEELSSIDERIAFIKGHKAKPHFELHPFRGVGGNLLKLTCRIKLDIFIKCELNRYYHIDWICKR